MTVPPWTQPGGFDEAGAWATAELSRLGRRVSGPIESVHARIWSTVLRIPTEGGNVFLKACGPAGFHEPRLLRFLAESFPGRTPRVIAVNESRKWVILEDAGGERLREVLARDRDLRHWHAVLPLYAQTQIDLVGRVKDLLPLDVPDDRLAKLPTQLLCLLEDVELLYLDQPGGLRSSDHARLCRLLYRIRRICDEDLLACGIPQTLHHGDLHDGNVFVVHPGPRYVIFDWGDSSLTHPFFTLRTTAASVGRTLGISVESNEWSDLRDAYLEPWARFASRDAVRAAADLAAKLAPLEGAIRWHHVLAAVPAELRQDWREPIPRLLEDLLASLG